MGTFCSILVCTLGLEQEGGRGNNSFPVVESSEELATSAENRVVLRTQRAKRVSSEIPSATPHSEK